MTALTSAYWTTSEMEVATVRWGGLVTAGRINRAATITADAWWLGRAVSGSAEVTVRRPVASVEVTHSADTVFVGHALRLAAEPVDESGHAVPVPRFSCRSSETAVATVASMGSLGLVRRVAPGRATISVTAERIQASAEITVVPDPERAAFSVLHARTMEASWSNDDH